MSTSRSAFGVLNIGAILVPCFPENVAKGDIWCHRGMGLDVASLLKNGMPAYQSRKKSSENGLRRRRTGGAARILAAKLNTKDRPC